MYGLHSVVLHNPKYPPTQYSNLWMVGCLGLCKKDNIHIGYYPQPPIRKILSSPAVRTHISECSPVTKLLWVHLLKSKLFDIH